MSTEPDATGADRDEEIAALRREVEYLHDRLDELEARLGPGPSSLPPAASDHRDARVLEALTRGETVGVKGLHTLYDERTDVRDDAVRRDRVKDLVETPAFERVDTRTWRYLGPATDGGDSDE
jgi:hypothetical protein